MDYFIASRYGHKETLYRLGELHLDSERQFMTFNELIPYHRNFHVIDQINSPRLIPILQSVCNMVEALMKNLRKKLNITGGGNFDEVLSDLDKNGMLSVQRVALKENLEILTPFTYQKGHSPAWWQAYNATKHHLPIGASCATVGHTLNALGALYVLIHLTKFWIKTRHPNPMLNGSNWIDNSDEIVCYIRENKFREWTRTTVEDAASDYLQSKTKNFNSLLFYYCNKFR